MSTKDQVTVAPIPETCGNTEVVKFVKQPFVEPQAMEVVEAGACQATTSGLVCDVDSGTTEISAARIKPAVRLIVSIMDGSPSYGSRNAKGATTELLAVIEPRGLGRGVVLV